jgi:HK97 family phage prohead protease
MKEQSSAPNKQQGAKREIRVSRQPGNTKFEVRTDPNTGNRTVAGYFAVFNVLSKDLGFREKLIPGCFRASLESRAVQCLFNHDDSKLLGRTESRTLEVWEDNKGLAFRVTLPNTTYANDLVALLQRGDSFECSFGFWVPDGGDEWSQMPDGTLLRVITRAEVFEGSILASPAAYPETSASLRSLPNKLRGFLDRGKRLDADHSGDDPDCDPDIDDDRPEEDRCDCECNECQEGDCDECSNDSCDDDSCADEGCPAASETRSLRKRLDKAMLRRLDDIRDAAFESDRAWVVQRLKQLSQNN